MIIGIPREIKNQEHRVALSPDGARQLVADGHDVRIQHDAGAESSYQDSAYKEAGALIVEHADEAWRADLVVKIKEPLTEEFDLMHPGLGLFTYLHLAAAPALADVLLEKQIRAIAYETVQQNDGSLPLLAPMSRIAGRLAAQIGANLLQRENGTSHPGKGVLMGGAEGARAAHVLVLGGGNVGCNAAEVALGMGATVHILDTDVERVAQLRERFSQSEDRCNVRFFAGQMMFELLDECDILIGAALIPGDHAPTLLTASYLERMAGGVFVDVAIDQGGISQSSRPTSYADPVYVEADVLHCCLPNLPASVPISATQALTHATFPFVRKLAMSGLHKAVKEDLMLARGVNTWDGHLTHKSVAHALNKQYRSLASL